MSSPDPTRTAQRVTTSAADEPSAPRRGGRDGRVGTAVLLGVVGLLVLLFVALGSWQLRRWDEAKADAAALEARLDDLAAPLDGMAGAAADPEALRFEPVVAVGSWVPADEVLWRNRSWRGQQGFHVVTPLRLADPIALADGTTATHVLVDRGWVPATLDEPPVAEATPPAGPVTVRGYLLPSIDQPGFGARDPDEGELERVFNVDVPRLDAQVDGTLFPLFVRTTAPTAGDDATALPRVPDDPEVDTTQNLSYAVQWFSFALLAVVTTAVYLRRRRGSRGASSR